MNKKILFVGLGSAGQRHLRNLLKLLDGKVDVLAYRYHKSERVFDSDMQVIENETLVNRYGIIEFNEYENALNETPDMVIISNPNSLHVPYALKAAERGLDLFIEKPLSTSLECTKELIETINKNSVICQVGYQYHYHPCIRQSKELIETNKLGKIISVYAEVGERISKMHSYENYTDMLEGSKELGGGVVLCQIHELDYLLWLFGTPRCVYSVGGKKSDFEIDVEDTATTILRYDNVMGDFPIVLHQDFLQYPPSRKCKIIGTKGRVEFDLLKVVLNYEDYEVGTCVEHNYGEFQKNDMFVAEMQDFLRSTETRESTKWDAQAALISTKIGLMIKESLRNGREVYIDEGI